MENFAEFEAGDYLDNEETIAEYLKAALEDGNSDVVLAAVADVAKLYSLSATSELNLQDLLIQITEENLHQEVDNGFAEGEEVL
jgi:DNA-binding phage protein